MYKELPKIPGEKFYVLQLFHTYLLKVGSFSDTFPGVGNTEVYMKKTRYTSGTGNITLN